MKMSQHPQNDETIPPLPVVLALAGSDPGGGAGLQADLKMIHACGGYAATGVTSVTIQNTRAVQSTYDLPLRVIEAQITALFSDFDIRAVKTGMLSSKPIVRRVARLLAQFSAPNLVVDPVLWAKGGYPLLHPDALPILKSALMPQARLVTPNLPEAEALAEMQIRSLDDAAEAARRIQKLGCQAVLIKGGHVTASIAGWTAATDLLVDGDQVIPIRGEQIAGVHPHGTGCVYSAAIATSLARGEPLVAAILKAKRQITSAIRHARPLGGGHPILHLPPQDHPSP